MTQNETGKLHCATKTIDLGDQITVGDCMEELRGCITDMYDAMASLAALLSCGMGG